MHYHYNAANTKCFVEMLERLFSVLEEMLGHENNEKNADNDL